MASALRGIIVRGIRWPAAQTSILNGCKLSLRSLSSHVDLTEDQIIYSASSVIKSFDDIIKRDPNPNKVYKLIIDMVNTDSRCKTYPQEAKLRVMSRALEILQNYPQVDSFQVFQVRMYIRAMMSDDDNGNKDDITKDEVISRVLDVIKCYPKVDHSKVTEESHFHNDLGLDEKESDLIVCGLGTEFNLPDIPEGEIDSCKLAIDYIYDRCIERCDDAVYDIISNTSYAIERVDDLIKSGNPDPEIAYKAVDIIDNKLEEYSDYVQLRVLSEVFDVIQNYPQVDSAQVLEIRMYIRTMLSINDDSEADITKDEVISRVLEVIKSYPKVDHSKVTEESHFHNDLGLDEKENELIVAMLGLEFKLLIPEEDVIDSCKLAIDYIYDHRMERCSVDEFISKSGWLDSDS